MKTWIFAISFVSLGLVAGISYVANNSLSVGNTSMELDSETNQLASLKATHTVLENSVGSGSEREIGQDTFLSDLIAKLQITHHGDIHLLHIQASLIKVKAFVLQRYPSDGERKFIEVITAAFPEYATSILALLDKLDIFNDWLIENQTSLLALEHQIQQGTIWEKRRELFGSDAEKIWAHELSGMADQKTAMQQVIQTLDQAHEISMEEKLFQLQTAIDEQLAGTVQAEAMSGGLISKVFFTLNSVQQELAAMVPEARQEKINDIRAQLGLNEEQIERLQKKDQERELRWENGLAYMAEREQLMVSADEYTRDAELEALRQRYFGPQAVTIQREEESNFWRYQRKRIYGVN